MRAIGVGLLGLIGVVILLSLGFWQVQRLAWKETVLGDITGRITAAPVAVPAQPDPTSDRFLPVRATGQFIPGPVRVLVSQKRVGAGYRLINAFQTEDGRRIMVDRGFVTVQSSQTPPAPQGTTTVTGNLHWPQEVDSFTPDNDLAANIWFARDVPTLADHLQADPILIIARTVDGDDGVARLPVGTDGIPNDHLQYAITWFSLAGIWLFMTLYFLYRQRQRQA